MPELVGDCVIALAMLESSNNLEAWGDNGHAMGRWQVHADRLVYESGKLYIWPKLGESYDAWVERIVTQIFFENLPRRSAVSIAMYWHVGHWVLNDENEWDAGYAKSFIAALAKGQASR